MQEDLDRVLQDAAKGSVPEIHKEEEYTFYYPQPDGTVRFSRYTPFRKADGTVEFATPAAF
jgi:hypothetical protein